MTAYDAPTLAAKLRMLSHSIEELAARKHAEHLVPAAPAQLGDRA